MIQQQPQKQFTFVSTLPDENIPLYYKQYYKRNKTDDDQEQLYFEGEEYDYGVTNKVLAEAVIKNKQLNYKQLSANVVNHLLNKQNVNNQEYQNDVQLILQFNNHIPSLDTQKKQLYHVAYFYNLQPVTEEEFKEKLQKHKPNIATNSLILDLQLQSNTNINPIQTTENTSDDEEKYEVVKFDLEHSISKPEKYITQVFNKYLFCNVKITTQQFDIISAYANRRLGSNTLFRIINNPVNDKFIIYQFLGPVPTSSQFNHLRIQTKNEVQQSRVQLVSKEKYERIKLKFLSRMKDIVQCPDKSYFFIAYSKPQTQEQFINILSASYYKVLTDGQLQQIQQKLAEDEVNINTDDVNYIIQRVPVKEVIFSMKLEEINNQYNCDFLYKIVNYDKEGKCTKYYVLGKLMTMAQLKYLSEQYVEPQPQDSIKIISQLMDTSFSSDIRDNIQKLEEADAYLQQIHQSMRHFNKKIDNTIYLEEEFESPQEHVNKVQTIQLNQTNKQKEQLYKSISDALTQQFFDKVEWRKEQYEENYRLYLAFLEKARQMKEEQEKEQLEQQQLEKERIQQLKAIQKREQQEKWRIKFKEQQELYDKKVNFSKTIHQELMKEALERKKRKQELDEIKRQKIEEEKRQKEKEVEIQEQNSKQTPLNLSLSKQTPDTQFYQEIDEQFKSQIKQINIAKSPNLNTSTSSAAVLSQNSTKQTPQLQIYKKPIETSLPGYQSINQDFPKVAEHKDLEKSDDFDIDLSISNDMSEQRPVQKKKKKSKSKSYEILLPDENINYSSELPGVTAQQAQSYKTIAETQDDLEIDLG